MGIGEQFDTVGDLVDWLLVQPRDRRVVLAKDTEGNGFSPLATVSVGMYVAESTYAGEVYPTDDDIDAEDSGYDEEDRAPSDAEPVVVLCPVN